MVYGLPQKLARLEARVRALSARLDEIEAVLAAVEVPEEVPGDVSSGA